MAFLIIKIMETKVFTIILTLLLNLTSAVDYCALCDNGIHTMCKYKGPSKTCSGYKKIELSSEEKKYIVDIHNDIRNHVASGMEIRGALGSQPPAADMLMLDWDNELAQIAQRWADQCIRVNASVQHDICKRTERFEVGQNILTAITTNPELPELSILIYNWYKQVANVIPSDIDLFSGIYKGKYLIGQYTQLVWSKTKYVGCGLVTFTDPTVSDGQTTLYQHRLVCNYGPAGNVIGEAVYQRGSPCSKCPNQKCDGVRSNLCRGTSANATPYDTKSDLVDKQGSPQSNTTSFSANISEIMKANLNNSKCLDLLKLINKTKCIGINKSNITIFNSSDLKIKIDSFKDLIYALSLDMTKYHAKPNLPATIPSSNLTTTTIKSATGLSNGRNITVWKEDDTEKATYASPFTRLSYVTEFNTKSIYRPPRNKSANVKENDEDSLKIAAYISTVIPSIGMNRSILEGVLNQNLTIVYTSTEKSLTSDLNLLDLIQDPDKYPNVYRLKDGIVLIDDSEDHYQHLKSSQGRNRQSHFKLTNFTDDKEVVVPKRGPFKKATGIWHNGHCRCPEMYRSHSATLKSAPLLVLVILLFV